MGLNIKNVITEIKNTNGDNAKLVALKKYSDSELLKNVLYLTHSKKITYGIKIIPPYNDTDEGTLSLADALIELNELISRNLTGHAATEFLSNLLSSLSSDDAYVVTRIIKRSLKIDMGTTNINKVFNKLIEKTPYMGAKPYSAELVDKLFTSGKPVYSQIKMDGRYCNAVISDGVVILESRQGEETHVGNAKFLSELTSFSDGVLNGELTIDGIPRYKSNGLITSIIKIEKERNSLSIPETVKKIEKFNHKNLEYGTYTEILSKIRFTVWDFITLDEYVNMKSERLADTRIFILNSLLNEQNYTLVNFVEHKVVSNKVEAMAHFTDAINRKLEGTILKASNGLWKNGKHATQIKFKVEIQLDLKIVGFQYGGDDTKNAHLISTLNVESADGTLKTNPSNMNDAMMEYVTSNQDTLLGTIVEVRCCGLSQNDKGEYSTLHPSVNELRTDKLIADTLQECIAIENAAKELN